jgi:hypothetical protein
MGSESRFGSRLVRLFRLRMEKKRESGGGGGERGVTSDLNRLSTGSEKTVAYLIVGWQLAVLLTRTVGPSRPSVKDGSACWRSDATSASPDSSGFALRSVPVFALQLLERDLLSKHSCFRSRY